MGRKGDSSYWDIDRKKLGMLSSASFSHWAADTWQNSKILVGSLANSFIFYAHNHMTNKTYLIIIWLLALLLSWIQIWKGITLAVTLKSHGAWSQGHTANKDRGSGLLSWTWAPQAALCMQVASLPKHWSSPVTDKAFLKTKKYYGKHWQT